MPKQSTAQKKITERVMHKFKHGKLKSGPKGKSGQVKSRTQAIAIALSESGSSNQKSKSENTRNFRKATSKERAGKTAMQEKEGSMKESGTSSRTMLRSPTSRTSSARSKTRSK